MKPKDGRAGELCAEVCEGLLQRLVAEGEWFASGLVSGRSPGSAGRGKPLPRTERVLCPGTCVGVGRGLFPPLSHLLFYLTLNAVGLRVFLTR